MKNTKSYIGWCYQILWDKYSVLLKGTLERGIGKGLPPMDSKNTCRVYESTPIE
jgi:hypothetical protein